MSMNYGHAMSAVDKGKIEDACIDVMERYEPLPGQQMTKQYQRTLRTIMKQDIRDEGWERFRYTGKKVFRINEKTGELLELNFVEPDETYSYDRRTVRLLMPTFEKHYMDELLESQKYFQRLR